MGVKLGDLIPPEAVQTVQLKDLSDKTIAIDGYNILYQFLSIIRGPDGRPLQDRKGRVTSHLSGLFFRTTNFLKNGMKVVYVFDGQPPQLKRETIRKRIELREKAKKMYEEALAAGQAEEARELLVPAALLKLVVRSAEGELRLGWDATRVCFAAGSTTIWGTLLTEQYPNWRSVIPTASTRRAVFERKSLEEALKRVALFAPHTARVVRLNFTAQGVRLSAQDEGSGHRAEEFLPCQYEGEELLIGFNAEYLQDALDALAPASAVTMFATEPNRAVMFLDAAATEGHSDVPPLEELPALALLMPMRL